MGGAFSRSKGQRAERDVIKLLQPVVTEVFEAMGKPAPALERNLMQSRNGGYDVVGLEWMALEVKHHETLNINQWWVQTKNQAGDSRIPVLFYKSNRVKWRVMMFGYLGAGAQRIRCPVDISAEAFLAFLRAMIKEQLSRQLIQALG